MKKAQTLQELGFILGRCREENGFSVDQVAHLLHIRARYLEAIEAGHFEELPGAAYTRGYLQNYAGFLGLSRQEVLEVFEAIESRQEEGFFLPEVLTKETKPSRTLVMASLGGALVFYALWSVVHQGTPGDATRIIADVTAAEHLEQNYAPSAGANPCAGKDAALFPPCYARGNTMSYSLLPTSIGSVLELAAFYRQQVINDD